jgi:tRNA pseudouridine55 synthase
MPGITPPTPISLTRIARRRVDGVLLLDKPAGLTSNGALMRVKRLYNAEKAGHTGTLDPLASGLLPICFGTATRFAQFLLDARKRYVATVRFGETTSTQDAEGETVASRPVTFDLGALHAALARFTGPLMQTPPAHAALKFQGRPYYDYARRGIDIPRPPRAITIDAVRLLRWQPPDAILDVECSKGTYVRVLAADLGDALGCGAHLAALRRTASGGFDVADAVTIEALELMAGTARNALLRPPDCLLGALPRVDLDVDDVSSIRAGRRIAAPMGVHGSYRAYAPDGALLGVLGYDNGLLVPKRLLPTGQPS